MDIHFCKAQSGGSSSNLFGPTRWFGRGDALVARTIGNLQAVSLVTGFLIEITASRDGEGSSRLLEMGIPLPFDDARYVLLYWHLCADPWRMLRAAFQPEIRLIGLPRQLCAVLKGQLKMALQRTGLCLYSRGEIQDPGQGITGEIVNLDATGIRRRNFSLQLGGEPWCQPADHLRAVAPTTEP